MFSSTTTNLQARHSSTPVLSGNIIHGLKNQLINRVIVAIFSDLNYQWQQVRSGV